ncbi:DUF5667 domain-containing protein [Nocardioides campestrisoli]|uniref:DUF5667 domain-containing protein n=1 Tax=Nocardioides campestrisoli TaxID=2736757 RepID=UPI00163DC4DC|nr:DUF5667 domain-containing protein [Nocardioides campestrisoli]
MTTPPFGTRRRAEHLDALLRQPEGAAARGGRDADLLPVVAALRGVGGPEPRSEFVSDLRSRLMAEAESALVPRDPAPAPRGPAPGGGSPRRSRRDRGVAVGLGTLALLGASGAVGVASQAALPGEMLYPVKTVLESARTTVATGDRDEGRFLLARAALRLDELDQLAGRDDESSRRALTPTLDTFVEQAQEGADRLLRDYDSSGRRSSVEEVLRFTASAMPRLATLADSLTSSSAAGVPAEARDALVEAGRALLAVDDRARAACHDCAGEGVSDVPRFLAAEPPGPVLPPGATAGQEGPGTTEPSSGPERRAPRLGPAPTGTPGTAGTPTPSTTPPPSGTPTPAPPPGTPRTPTPAPKPPAPPTSSPTPAPAPTPRAPETDPPTATPTPTTLLDGVGDVLGEVTGTLLGEGVGDVVDKTTGAVGELLGQVLRTPGPRNP